MPDFVKQITQESQTMGFGLPSLISTFVKLRWQN